MKEEKDVLPTEVPVFEEGTKRKLLGRHLQMIAIGGTIGTGLFLKSGDTIGVSGAIGSLIAFMVAGLSVFCVIMSLGEMATLFPISGSFSTFAERFVDPALGFTTGWTYWYQWAITLPIELQAAVAFLSYWFDGVKLPAIHPWVWYIAICALLLAINLFTVSGFGEVEYWLSLLKILAIVFFIFTGIVIVFRDNLGPSTWKAGGGPFAGNGVLGIFLSMVSACFSFGGTELVGITAGEAANPRVAVPRAINGTFWRILIFYILSILLIGMIIPASTFQEFIKSGAGDLVKSPFVLAFNIAHIPAAGDIMNAVGLIAVLSAGNSAVYASSRTLMALCSSGQGPKFFTYTSKAGVPIPAILLTGVFGMISLLGTVFGEGEIFNWLINFIGLTIILTWSCISITHLKFRKAYIDQGYKLEDLPYRSPIGVYGDYISLAINISIIFLSYFGSIMNGAEFVFLKFFQNYCGLLPYPILFFGWKMYKRTKMVRSSEANLITGHVSNHDEPEEIDEAPKSTWSKVLAFLA